ncbi:Hypothetical protein R9X50_00478100 [Acrodontium crateriforme]|uniref:SigF-like NTF2-like domain-containing protein n=1 Tax=Acrodontium crateriforme TaxID=150365 RepID=A0AAQ3M6Q7_9PEZI|nr:Hypothetical protein R9X50_00478100 [Acrodontium crateriforme]
MENPVEDITGVIHKLTQGSPHVQEKAINTYFTPNASFTHPFCRTGSFEGSRLLIHAIFRWYKILSPTIDLTVKSVAFDKTNLLLYVTISQVFSIWLIPFYRAPVTLTTVLQLHKPPHTSKYYIQSQNDLYQVDQFVRFVAPWGIGSTLVILWHLVATFFCVLGAVLFVPVTWVEQRRANSKVDGRNEGEETGDRVVEASRSWVQQFGDIHLFKRD